MKVMTLLQIFVMKPKPRNFVQPRLFQSPAAAAAAASVKAAYAVITATDEKTKDIVATDDLDVKRAEPGSSSKQMVAEIDALNGEKGELESRLAEVRSENSKLKDKLDMVKLSYGELTKVKFSFHLFSLRGQTFFPYCKRKFLIHHNKFPLLFSFSFEGT